MKGCAASDLRKGWMDVLCEVNGIFSMRSCRATVMQFFVILLRVLPMEYRVELLDFTRKISWSSLSVAESAPIKLTDPFLMLQKIGSLIELWIDRFRCTSIQNKDRLPPLLLTQSEKGNTRCCFDSVHQLSFSWIASSMALDALIQNNVRCPLMRAVPIICHISLSSPCAFVPSYSRDRPIDAGVLEGGASLALNLKSDFCRVQGKREQVGHASGRTGSEQLHRDPRPVPGRRRLPRGHSRPRRRRRRRCRHSVAIWISLFWYLNPSSGFWICLLVSESVFWYLNLPSGIWICLLLY